MKTNKSTKLLVATLLSISLLAGCTAEEDGKIPDGKPQVEDLSEDVEKEEPEEEKEEPKEERGDKAIVLGETIEFDDFNVTVTKVDIVKSYDDKPLLRITYDYKNTGDEEQSPFMSINFKGFQDGIEVEDFIVSDDIDLGLGQKKLKGGGELKDIQAGVGIEDLEKELNVEMKEFLTFKDNVVYTLDVVPKDLQK